MAEQAESDSDANTPDLSDLADVSNVLLLSPSIGGDAEGMCFDLLTQAPPEQTTVLSVTFRDSPQEWASAWTEHVGSPPGRGGIVAVGQMGGSSPDSTWTVSRVDNPSDLTGIGIELSELLSSMTSGESAEAIVMCFDSITSLLQYADLQRTFRFLHVVTGRIKTVGGFAHYHLDPEAHDKQTVATLKGLFDAVVQQTPDGEWEIQR